MTDTAGAADTHVVEVDLGTLSGRAVVVRARRGTGTDGAALTGAPRTGPTTLWREGRER
jgi:hypothetical protein